MQNRCREKTCLAGPLTSMQNNLCPYSLDSGLSCTGGSEVVSHLGTNLTAFSPLQTPQVSSKPESVKERRACIL